MLHGDIIFKQSDTMLHKDIIFKQSDTMLHGYILYFNSLIFCRTALRSIGVDPAQVGAGASVDRGTASQALIGQREDERRDTRDDM